MAEPYHGHSKSKSSRNVRDHEEVKERSRKSRNSKDSSKYHHLESRTPPLPVRSRSSLEELLKKKHTLKREIKEIDKHYDNDIRNRHELKVNRKRVSSDVQMNRVISKKKYSNDKIDSIKRPARELSPEKHVNYTLVESEDEETIIEERRKKRKELLEKLKHKCDNQNSTNEIVNKSNVKNIENNKKSPVKMITELKKTTDMFSENDDFISMPDNMIQDNNDNAQLIDNWDDSEGYYNIKLGEKINNNRYTIKSLLGQGVFANVARAQDSNEGNADVAIKIIRNNDLMYQTGLKEIATLKELGNADPEAKYHCVKLLGYFMHKGHLCLVLEPLFMDMRSIIKKYGRHQGLNMKALMSYSRQLLLALRLLKKVGVVHADIKPDNILVNEKKNVLKLCDFGSAAKVDENEPTPYLVSRFYRAPEIILGVPYNYSVDTWSTACTIYEMATGKIMFTGSSNNKMLKCFMDLKGRIPSKLIRKGKFKDQHFNYNNNFLLHKKDGVTEREKYVEMNNVNAVRDLEKELKKSYNSMVSMNEDRKIKQLKDLLDKMLVLDPKQRLSNTDCLKHPFIQEEFQHY